MPADLEVAPALCQVHAQLLLAARREAWVGDAVAASLGHDAVSVLCAARRRHPLSIPETLADLAALGDAHDVLERCAESLFAREAAGHRAILLLFGDDAEVRLRLAAFDHGLESGRELSGGRRGPSGVLDGLATWLLEDMPCRSSVALLSEEPRRVRWAHARCPYRAAWQHAGAEMRPACQILSAWIRGLASGMDASVEYRRPRAIALGDDRCEHELIQIG